VGSKGKSRFKGPRVPVSRTQQMQQLEQLQAQMAQAQAALAEATVMGSAGGGAVTIEMTGDQAVRAVKIKPEVVDPEDVAMLEDLILAAFNDALEKSRKLAEERLAPLTGGLELPGLF
jgi:DNA-binding YbaB/EbfC family protein